MSFSHLPIVRLVACIAATALTIKSVAPEIDDDHRLEYFGGCPGFLESRQSIIDEFGVDQDVMDATISAADPKLQASLSQLIHDKRLENIWSALSRPNQIYRLSSKLPEAGSICRATTSYRARLSDAVYTDAVCLRISYPFHTGRTECQLCKLPADETAVHDLVCSKAQGESFRHKLAQDACRDALREADNWLIHQLQPAYADFYTAKTISASNKICKSDLFISSVFPNDLTDGQKYLIDFTVCGPSEGNKRTALIAPGALAAAAELRKTMEVDARWYRPSNAPEFVPFAIEISGGFGSRARNLLAEIFALPRIPHADDEVRPAKRAAIMRERQAKMNALWRVKDAMVAAVCRGNHFILESYRHQKETTSTTTTSRGSPSE